MIVIYYQIKILIDFWCNRYRTLYLLFDENSPENLRAFTSVLI